MRVYGVARQSRGDDKTKSVPEQERRIREWCEREGHELVGVGSEQDVSGGRPLDKRPGLKAAVAAVEAGEADAVAVVYFDRLVRSMKVQAEVQERVEAASGKVVTLDLGEVSTDTAARWLASQNIGMMSEFFRRLARERALATRAEHERNGTWPGGRLPVGLALEAGKLVPGEHAAAVLEAYRMRERGSSLEMTRSYLREATGLELRSLNIVQRLLRNPVYAELGVVPADLFRRVSGLKAPRGRRPSSDRLLARLGVLRCSQCGSRMVVATATGSRGQRVPVYRCPPGNGCTSKQSITATMAEEVVVRATRIALKEVEGKAGGDTKAAESRVERANAAFEKFVEAWSEDDDVASVRSRKETLRAELEEAEDALERARLQASFTFKPGLNWDELTLDERRDLVRSVVGRAEVMPGKGRERVVVTLAPELADAQRVVDKAAEAFRDDLDL